MSPKTSPLKREHDNKPFEFEVPYFQTNPYPHSMLM